MDIRKIEPKDFATVAQLENENWSLRSTPHIMNSSAEKILEKIFKGATYLLAVEKNQILGVLDFAPRHQSEFGSHVLTFGIMTAKNARGRGVATALINHFVDFARQDGYEKITIQVLSSNPEAIQLYHKLGFVEEGCLKKEFHINGNDIDDYIFCFYLNKI